MDDALILSLIHIWSAARFPPSAAAERSEPSELHDRWTFSALQNALCPASDPEWQDAHPEFTRIVFHGLRHSSATYQLMISGGDVTVSYTHLAAGRPADSQRSARALSAPRQYFPGKGPRPDTAHAVSYTHLDVYKRQEQMLMILPPPCAIMSGMMAFAPMKGAFRSTSMT